ncbi:hypothetical protein NB639_03955 [Oxalobacter formigenes]|uniref:hypothetical protein n=1 Tax=Oxalobacter formigenes TaxID=847 RepID=UPI0022AF8A54|nr:hypothetical protein [Oxalobacter formigenes]WAW06575.1 hypothetical protein NB639_03955 [Oxalobacter formigenes]
MQKLNALACPLSLWTNLCKNDVWHTQSLDIQFGLSACLFFVQPVSGFASASFVSESSAIVIYV